MRKLCLLCLFLFVFPVYVFAQDSGQKEEILSARKREKEKIKNREFCANLTFKQSTRDNRCFEFYPTRIIDWGKGFSNGLAKITVDGKAGFINTKGEIVIKPRLKDAGYFSDNLAPFESENGKWGFINSKGEMTIKPQFDWALSFKEGYALVQVGNLWGFIDQTGKIVIEPKFKEASGFSEGLARVAIFDTDYVWENTNIPNAKSYWGFIDKQGNWAIQPTLNYIYKDFNGGMALISIKSIGNNYDERYFVDKQGNKVWKLTSSIIYGFSDDALVVKVGEDKQKHDTYSFVDRNGKRVTDKSFSYLSRFSEGLSAARVTWEGKFGFINKKGDFVIEPKFDWAKSFSEGLAGVEERGEGYGFIDKSGNWVIKPQFYWIWEFQEGFALVAPKGNRETQEKTGYIDRNGNYIWKPTK